MANGLSGEILVGIVTRNRRDKLIKTLAECSFQGFNDIVVVDNGSSDGTREFLLGERGVETIISDRNEGGSGGFNRIMRHFLEHSRHGWLLMFDDDAYPSFSASALRAFLLSEAAANRPAYALKVLYTDGTMCEMNRPGLNILETHPFRALHGDHHVQESAGSCLVDFASFVGIVLKRDTIAQSGYVSKEFFIYSDDTYYTLSVSSRLGQIRYCPEFVLIHDCNRTSRRLLNHDSARLQREVANKIVLIREYSKFQTHYVVLYVARLIFKNPTRVLEILHASYTGIFANLQLYRNERAC